MNKIDHEIKRITTSHIEKTFSFMFGMDIKSIKEYDGSWSNKTKISRVVLSRSGEIKFILRFAFPPGTLIPLLQGLYGGEMALQDEIIEDAVCEISNIVCTGLKSELNNQGYNLDMSLPAIETTHKTADYDEPNHLFLDFMLQGEGFSVDIELCQKLMKRVKEDENF